MKDDKPVSYEPLPEPQVPLRNMGEILDKEIPIRVRKELKIIRQKIVKGLGKILLQSSPIVVSALVLYYK